jgi:2-polyprenyl-3-methyl-5-hydroxy-6-metoxy-1,4-benzoquinol methylase
MILGEQTPRRRSPLAKSLEERCVDWDPVTHYKEIAIAERYDAVRFSSVAGQVFNALEKKMVQRAFAGVPKDAHVIDVPCGTGRLAEPLLELGYSIVGVDISDAMLVVAKRRLQRFGSQFVAKTADVRELAKQAPSSFDYALCARVLMHFPLDEQIVFLRSVAQIARKGVIFTQSLDTPYQRSRRRLKRLLRHQVSANYPITTKDLRKLLQGSGLAEVRRIRPMPLLTEEVIVVAKRIA